MSKHQNVLINNSFSLTTLLKARYKPIEGFNNSFELLVTQMHNNISCNDKASMKNIDNSIQTMKLLKNKHSTYQFSKAYQSPLILYIFENNKSEEKS